MATVTRVMRSCDICGNEKDVQTWTFGLEGKAYEIDLCPKDGKDLGKVAAGYISNARQAPTRHGQRRGGSGRRLSGYRPGHR
jgi:ribosome-binding protein aMBF1 (putative translation factor)